VGAEVTPYYEDDAVTIYHGDAREILPMLTFDAVVTDPPYGIGYQQTIKTARDWGTISGDESDALARWVIEAVHPTPMLVFGANHFPSALPEPGRWVCWDKRVVEAADRMLGSPFELAWMNGPDKAGFMYRIQHGGVVNADKGNLRRTHPTQKPVTLMKRIIEDHFPTGVIADPFMGAGSTLRAAKDLGRRAVGIEIEEQYCEAAVARLAQEVLAL
jgi:site-specific DNA-methyltransferase (adenine-specific)